MRRTNREIVGLENILAVLDKCEVMRLGLCADAKPYIVPMNFAYEKTNDKLFIYFHCASEGKKLDMIAKNSNVCFEADCSFKLLKAETACAWAAEFESVIGEGVIAVVTDEAQKIPALDLLMKRYGFPGKPHYSPEQLAAVTVLRISVDTITGKHRIRGK